MWQPDCGCGIPISKEGLPAEDWKDARPGRCDCISSSAILRAGRDNAARGKPAWLWACEWCWTEDLRPAWRCRYELRLLTFSIPPVFVVIEIIWKQKKPRSFWKINPKRPGPDMKKADRISRIISLKTVCCFQYFVVSVGGVPPKSVKKIFDPRLELFSNRCLRKFESYMIGDKV